MIWMDIHPRISCFWWFDNRHNNWKWKNTNTHICSIREIFSASSCSHSNTCDVSRIDRFSSTFLSASLIWFWRSSIRNNNKFEYQNTELKILNKKSSGRWKTYKILVAKNIISLNYIPRDRYILWRSLNYTTMKYLVNHESTDR